MTPDVVLDRRILGESPQWYEGILRIAGWAAHDLLTLDDDGSYDVGERRPSSIPRCIDWLLDSLLLLVPGGRLLRGEPDGTPVINAELRSLDAHSWNDIAVDSRGTCFDFPGSEYAPGTFAVDAPDGTARAVARDLVFPNGMTFTPEGTTLIVAESYGNRPTAFIVGDDSALSDRRMWTDLPGYHPDGICLEAKGSVCAADVGKQQCVRVREGGQVRQTIDADPGCFASALGGPDGDTLYIVPAEFPNDIHTPTGQVLAIQIDAPSAA